MTLLLGIDVGTTGASAILINGPSTGRGEDLAFLRVDDLVYVESQHGILLPRILQEAIPWPDNFTVERLEKKTGQKCYTEVGIHPWRAWVDDRGRWVPCAVVKEAPGVTERLWEAEHSTVADERSVPFTNPG